MPSNTLYIPQTLAEMDASQLAGFGQGVGGACAALTSTQFNLTLTDDAVITGIQLISNGASIGDYLKLEVYAGPTLVASPIPGPWYVPQTDSINFDLAMPIKIPAGVTLRVTYNAVLAFVSPAVFVNFRLWKVLQ